MKIKKKHLTLGIAVIALAVIIFLVFLFMRASSTTSPAEPQQSTSYLNPDGTMKLPVRGKVTYKLSDYNSTDDVLIQKVVYESAKTDIYGLLLTPRKEGTFPGVVLLPGAGVRKENELPVALRIARLGYIVLTIDQRGTGETGGILPTFKQDYINYMSGKVAVQHLFVYDALTAADLLTTQEKIDDPIIIILAGESLGGRVAMIAGAIDDRIKGVLAISSSGFNFQPNGANPQADLFLESLDPDTYVAKISPRPLFMIHNFNDPVINITSAEVTLAKARDPRFLLAVNDTTCNHGFCASMAPALNFSLSAIAR